MTVTPLAAAVPVERMPARVRLRPAMQGNLRFVLSLEQDPDKLPFIAS